MSERRKNGQWAKGISGNPKGNKTGSRHRITIAAENVLNGEGEAISRKLIEKALEGDTNALRIAMDRILPPRKDRTIAMKLKGIKKPDDLIKIMHQITQAVAKGEISPQEGSQLSNMVETQRRTLETGEIAKRLEALEAAKEAGQ